MIDKLWDVIVVGAGHAGIEAVHAAAKMQMKTLLLTMSIENIGQMSCNPAIGGVGKGHLVREIDALGGVMGELADKSGIQFRTLNTKKGAAVQATRSQSDMVIYRQEAKSCLGGLAKLKIIQREVKSLLWSKGNLSVEGVITDRGEEIKAKAVILTTGTFLKGVIHIGKEQFSAGRAGEAPADSLSADLVRGGLKMGRLKTGTTPRLDKNTIDFSILEEQKGDNPAPKFSFWGDFQKLPQTSCFITYTNLHSHQIIKDNLDKSAMYGGEISSIGPRYCPSIEDKVVKFADKERHQIFLEPTSLSSIEFYPNGMSTSMPIDVQLDFMRSIKGLAKVDIIKPGYAIEYDFVYPHQLRLSLELKRVKNLYLAGQINGTTGYEEAAAQGLMAGVNASLKIKEKEPFILQRNQAYIGVLIDDLITKSTKEPYRMFTSRAEYRLLLREDNADERLSQKGHQVGLLAEHKYLMFLDKQKRKKRLTKLLNSQSVEVSRKKSNASNVITERRLLSQLLKNPEANLATLVQGLPPSFLDNLNEYTKAEKTLVTSDFKYEGYIKRQEAQIKSYLKMEHVFIPRQLDYNSVPGLSLEVKEKLVDNQPETLGQAQKISGITPAALTILSVFIRKKKHLASTI